MSTLPIRAPQTQVAWPVFAWPMAGFARLRTLVSAVIDVFAEAQAQARAVHNRYPFAE
jgi:hypothetical protein